MYRSFRLPEIGKYKGAGHGWVILNDDETEVIDFDYSDDFETAIDRANVEMTDRAGEKIGEHKYIANFSGWEACLF